MARRYKPQKVILYGSYAYGKPTYHSDIDLFIIKKTTKRWRDRFVEVKRLIYNHKNYISISPCVCTPQEVKERLAKGDTFIEEILTNGITLYEKK